MGRNGIKIYTLEFEYDPAKSEANKAKHGIDFDEAPALWNGEHRIEIPARTTDEPRFLVIGRIAGKHWSAIITYRDEPIRVVAVRCSRAEVVTVYEGQGE